ncbi:MAG: DUF1553 domain-containing protein [Planctomycetes bacterium]|nr:DUF1553 domain-containing protein [Planctomycetota bacterium]
MNGPAWRNMVAVMLMAALSVCAANAVAAEGTDANAKAAAQPPARGAKVDYNWDVRPILSDKCFRCHGPDAAHREGNLRLDRREDAVSDRPGCRAIVPGKPAESEVFRRITSDDADERMPPHASGSTLSKAEIETLTQWIAQGSEYQPHWAFTRPKLPALPAVRRTDWPRGPIDRLVLAELEERQLAPAPEAERAALLRRVTLDLTGLPPTLAELDAFLADTSADAYERAVDRLLASPRFGERLALDWMDAARYADTNGYYLDTERRIWRWRDWVINAFNQNMPFDRFTVEQLAGDLLPEATLEQQIATGFNRNHMTTNESGVIDEEARLGYVVDRVDTTAAVWLGLTFGCARCHDHKYDPITQEDYYRVLAFFNNVKEKGLIKDPINPAPILSLPTAEEDQQLADLTRQRTDKEKELKALGPTLAADIAAWEPKANGEIASLPATGCVAYFDLEKDGTSPIEPAVAARTLGELKFAPGVVGQGSAFDATQYVEFDGGVRLDRQQPFAVSLWIKPSGGPTGCVVSKMASTADARGFEVIWYKSQPRINLVNRWGQTAIEVVARQTFSAGAWRHLVVAYDGSGRAAGVKVFVDGEAQDLIVRRDSLGAESIATPEPWRIAWKGMGVGFEGGVDEFRLFNRTLSADEVTAIYWREMLDGAIATPRDQRTKQQAERLRQYYVAHYGSEQVRALDRELANLRKAEETLKQNIMSTPVMAELEKPRETNVLMRGQYDHPGKHVTPGVPTALGALADKPGVNRLDLARWLVAADNPLTARVIVNRYWQLVFGDGLVRTPNDFGLQGEAPTHPQLLDWLAVRFIESGWDVKALVRSLVTSATYRQSSRLTPALTARDPENRLLARASRYRLPAELVRDQALSIGGLLVEKVGGPSVKPYQPGGLWEAVSYNGDQSYVVDDGDGLHRRSLYSFWKRQAPPPAMLLFDGPTREVCTLRRARTNTPLQALVLLNDVTYVEAARGLATQILRHAPSDTAEAVRFGFRRATGRVPTKAEAERLEKYYHEQLAEYRAKPAAASALLAEGDAPVEASLAVSQQNQAQLAAWTMTASVLLNLDETITQH